MTTRRIADLPVPNAAAPLDEAVRDEAGVVVATPTAAASWDPYEVWLTRVKQPRERTMRRSPSSAVRGAPTGIGDANRATPSPALSG